MYSRFYYFLLLSNDLGYIASFYFITGLADQLIGLVLVALFICIHAVLPVHSSLLAISAIAPALPYLPTSMWVAWHHDIPYFLYIFDAALYYLG